MSKAMASKTVRLRLQSVCSSMLRTVQVGLRPFPVPRAVEREVLWTMSKGALSTLSIFPRPVFKVSASPYCLCSTFLRRVSSSNTARCTCLFNNTNSHFFATETKQHTQHPAKHSDDAHNPNHGEHHGEPHGESHEELHGEHDGSGSKHEKAWSDYLDRSEIEERTLRLLRGIEKVNKDKISPHAHLQRDLGLDSLDQVELMMLVEEEFDTNIKEDEGIDLDNVQAIIDHIAQTPFLTSEKPAHH